METIARSVAQGAQQVAKGVTAAVATPFVYTPLRPVAKQLIKGGLWAARSAQSLVTTTREQWADVVAEAKKEARSRESTLRLEAASSTVDGTRSNGETGGSEKGASGKTAAGDAAVGAPPYEDVVDALTQVKDIGDDYARLLQAAGITSVEQLAARDPAQLHDDLAVANEAHDVVGRVPSAKRIRGWIERAEERA